MAAVTRRCRIRTAFPPVVAMAIVAIVALTGCGHSGKPAATSATSTKTSASWSRPSAPPDPQTLLHVGALAVGKVPNGTLTLIRSQETGTWRVHVVTPDGTEQSMDVGSDGVTVLVGPTPKNQSDAEKTKNRDLAQAAHLDYRAAVNKFLAAVPNGSITEMKLTDSKGITVWDADVWDTYIVEHKVSVNASSGELIANKQV
ncbi:MAG: metallopeptidase [Mycobacterium sp.]|nr:metallopeptidase [Mycobacterium sp.]